MSDTPRRARVRALAKLNLGLKVLNKRPDGYHELRTVFQTISLADTIDIEFMPGRRSDVELVAEVDIPDNLVERAARLAMETLRIRGRVRFHLAKRIPAGAGMGGGSSDAAAVLLALPVLAGKRADLETLIELGGRLGSDVPFFLLGGTAVALGRGSELYPLPDVPARHGLAVMPPVQVSTPEAYRALR
ncbi:MAG: 4-(cytidine 5'-diphospho)-2-C-methyl-D-erythritol kinase, partial [Acidobacteria bacterium]|nr:4-(cytidine 5'-diphospho)-2-C-methyl-D-erythritol kinase [Acidobacteriota bacterium]